MFNVIWRVYIRFLTSLSAFISCHRRLVIVLPAWLEPKLSWHPDKFRLITVITFQVVFPIKRGRGPGNKAMPVWSVYYVILATFQQSQHAGLDFKWEILEDILCNIRHAMRFLRTYFKQQPKHSVKFKTFKTAQVFHDYRNPVIPFQRRPQNQKLFVAVAAKEANFLFFFSLPVCLVY